MKAADLFLQRDEGISFLGVAGNGDAADGKLDAQLRFDRGCDDGVIAEDLFGLVGIGRLAAHADAGVSVVRKFGTAKTDRIGCLTKEGGNQDFMNVGLSKSQHQALFSQRFLDAEELEVIAVDGGQFIRSVFEGEGKDRDFGTFDVLREMRIGAFDTDAAFFAEDNLSGILDSVEHAVAHLLDNIVDGDRAAGVVEVTAASIASGGRKQGSVGSLDAIAEEAEFLNQRNEGMEDFLVTAFSEAGAKVRERGTARDGIVGYPGKAAIRTARFRIVQDGAEVFDIGDLVEIAAEVENKQRDGVVARGAQDGIGIGSNGADEREIDERGDQLREAAADGAVVVDVDKSGMELIMGEPSGFFLRKRLLVGSNNSGIDFRELGDYSVNRELGEIDHLISSRVSREDLPTSKKLSGNPFLLSNSLYPTFPQNGNLIQTKASGSSESMKAGGVELRSFSRA